jgi:hypothetical protein
MRGDENRIEPDARNFFLKSFLVIQILGAFTHAEIHFKQVEETYAAVREMSLNTSEVLIVDTCLLQRDVGVFSFNSGSFFFFEEVEGRKLALFFDGNGTFTITPDNPIERQQLERFTGDGAPVIDFDYAYIFFTDSTYEYLSAQHDMSPFAGKSDLGEEVNKFREEIRRNFTANSDARLLYDILNFSKSDFFKAYFHSPIFGDMMFAIDPLRDERVTLLRYRSKRFEERADWETWYSTFAQDGKMRMPMLCDITDVILDVTINERSLSVKANVNFVCLLDGMQGAPLDLSPRLRIQQMILGSNDTCFVIQEKEAENAQAWVIFPEPLHAGSTYTFTCFCAGTEIIEDLGGGNFAVRERTHWYPTFYSQDRDAARFQIVFSLPEGLTLLGTGDHVRTWKEDGRVYSEWRSVGSCMHAGFNFGKFSKHSEKSDFFFFFFLTNTFLSDDLSEVRRIVERSKALQAELMMLPQELTTENMGKNAAIESRNAYNTYFHFFGPIPFTRIKISQQPQMSYAQSWPTLIYLPFTSFFRESVRERLGLVFDKESVVWYETVASHEMAHQWWGHTIMTGSYHDQWLEEGFATYAEALYLQMTEGTNRFKEFLEWEKKKIMGKM